jgi:dCMP deaminase
VAILDIDRQFLFRCDEVRRESFDPHRAVGAVIVSRNDSIIGTGTNKPPSEMGFTLQEIHELFAHDPKSKYFLLEHAERNAIADAYKNGQPIIGATIYCTLFPCADCARAIVSAGILRLVVPEQALDPIRDIKWADHYLYAREIFEKARVQVDLVVDAGLSETDSVAISARR